MVHTITRCVNTLHGVKLMNKLTVSVPEAARALGISRNTAYSLARAGKLPGVIELGPKRLVISKAALERLLGAPLDGDQQSEGAA